MTNEGAKGSDIGPYLKRPQGPRDWQGTFPYAVRGKNRGVEKDWDALCATSANNARRCFDFLATTPASRPIDTGRGNSLKGRLAGLQQYEVTGASRVWYRIHQEDAAVEVIRVSIGHPRETE